MTVPTQQQIAIGCVLARQELTVISGFINYNNEISDAQMTKFITTILNGALNATPLPPKEKK